MNKFNQTKEQDINDLRFMKQMIHESERQLRFNEISEKEYQYILSKTIANLEVLEIKYGLD